MTVFVPPAGSIFSPFPNYTLPTNAAAQQVPSPNIFVPPTPLPQTLFGADNVTSFSS